MKKNIQKEAKSNSSANVNTERSRAPKEHIETNELSPEATIRKITGHACIDTIKNAYVGQE